MTTPLGFDSVFMSILDTVGKIAKQKHTCKPILSDSLSGRVCFDNLITRRELKVKVNKKDVNVTRK